MDPHDRTALHDFAARHHVHYEVEPETASNGRRDELVGVRLRLFATREGAQLGAPACPACLDLLGELRSFADAVAAAAGVAERTETIPATRKLYQSPDASDQDEVALTLRVRCEAPEHRQPGAGEERCVAGVRERLAELGVARE